MHYEETTTFLHQNSSGKLLCFKCWLWKTPTHLGNHEGLTSFRAPTDPLFFAWMCTLPSAPHAPAFASILAHSHYGPLPWTTGSLTAMPMSFFFFFFLGFFWTWIIFKALIEFATKLFWFYVLALWPRGKWDLSSPTRDWTLTPCIGRQSLNHWTTSLQCLVFYLSCSYRVRHWEGFSVYGMNGQKSPWPIGTSQKMWVWTGNTLVESKNLLKQ